MSDENKNDQFLNDLLDNALQDFEKNDQPSAQNATTKSVPTVENDVDDPDAFFLEHAKQLADRMNTLFNAPLPDTNDTSSAVQNPEKMMESLKKIAEAASMTLSGESVPNEEEVSKYTDTIAKALKGLQEGTEGLAANDLETDVGNMFESLNLEGAGASGDGIMFLPFMEKMMQSLLSAEVLLPIIKELVEKYPKYLSENNDNLSDEEKERYQKQLELYKTIEEHLEKEKPEDTPAEKREKFRVVLEDMRKLQDYGQPPTEILIGKSGDLPFADPSSFGNGLQCPTM